MLTKNMEVYKACVIDKMVEKITETLNLDNIERIVRETIIMLRNGCEIHWYILGILIFAAVLTVIFRKKMKAYLVVLMSVAAIAIILCFYGNCEFDWVFAIAGTIILEIMDIIFVRLYDKESVESETKKTKM